MRWAHWLAMGLVAAPLLGEVTVTQPPTAPGSEPAAATAARPHREAILFHTQTAASAEAAEEGYRIQFVDVAASEVVRFIARLAKLNVIYDGPQLAFPITIVATEPTPIAELVAALTQVLRAHGLNVTEEGNNLIISPVPSGQSLASIVSDELGNSQSRQAGFVTRVFRLTSNPPSSVMVLVKALLSPQALVEPSDATNQLIVTDLAANVARIEQLLQSLDAPATPMDIGLFQPTYGDLHSLVALTERIMDPIKGAQSLVMVPQEGTNSLYVITSPFLMERTMAVLRSLDVPPEPNAAGQPSSGTTDLPKQHMERTDFSMYKLAYQRGDSIEKALQETAVALEKSGEVNLDLVSAIRSTTWIECNNTLVFTGAPEAIAKVHKLVSDLDVPLRQVYIEMLIVQTDLSDALQFGVDWAIDGKNLVDGNLNTGSGFDPNKTGIISALTGVTANSVLPDPNTFTNPVDFGLGVIGRAIRKGGLSFVTMGALIQALATDSESKILLTPRILAQDNTTATLFVGQNVPYQTSLITSTASPNTQGTLTYRDVGTTMQVTPLIGQGDIVTLEVNQTVATVSTATTTVQSSAGGSSQVIAPTTNTTTTTTRLHVPDGYFVIMSGMVTDNQIRSESRIPCLGSIPWLGQLFTNTNNSNETKDTMIFIRPRIIQSVEELMRVTTDSKCDLTKAYEGAKLLPQLQHTVKIIGPPTPQQPCPVPECPIPECVDPCRPGERSVPIGP